MGCRITMGPAAPGYSTATSGMYAAITSDSSIHAFERFSRFTDVLSGTTIFGPAGGAGFGIGNYGGISRARMTALLGL